jgi:MFS family permease
VPGVESRARTAVAVVFVLNGFAFASWVSRIPQARQRLDLTPGQLGTLLLALSVGSVLALPSAGRWVQRYGAGRVVAAAALFDALGLAIAGLGAGGLELAWVTGIGLFLLGLGSGTWDVAMNVEAAAVERRLGRTIMPRFHAAFSLGTVVGAALGAAAAAGDLAIPVHLLMAAVLVAALPAYAVRRFLPATSPDPARLTAPKPRSAWSEPRTLTIGLMVLAMALTEGVANDWLAVALVDGHHVPAWAGATGFALFVTAMTGGRLFGGGLLDRFGRLPVLWGSMALAAVGVVLVVLVPLLAVVAVGIVLWGVGASLGFPVGMSAASDDPRRAAPRVSVVSTIGYTAFLAGPPALGFLGDHVGVLHALLLVSVLLVPSALAVPAARPPRHVVPDA